MRKIRKKINRKFIVIAVVLLLTICIGYAVLSTTLLINGTANIASSSWLVYFTNVEVKTGSVTATTVPTTSGTSTITLTWAVTLSEPGQFYEYTVDVKNDGTIDAMLGSLSNTSLTTNQAKYLDYKVTYNDGAVIEKYDKLDAGETVKLKVRVEYKKDINPEDLPETEEEITFTYTSNYVQADENAKDRKSDSSLNLGDTVNYSTTMNGVTLDNWKVFYVDGDYTTLIYGDYLPNEVVDTTSLAFSNLKKYSTYAILANSNRIQFLDAMTTKENWNSLLIGAINGTPINYSEIADANIWAMGTPTVDLWVNSWNENYPDDTIYTAKTDTAMSDGLNGYYLGKTENPVETYINSTDIQAKDILYYPHKEPVSMSYGYWLASPSAVNTYSLVLVNYSGSIYGNGYADASLTIRPVISLPTNVLQ